MCSVWIAGVSAVTNQSDVNAAPTAGDRQHDHRHELRPARGLVLLARDRAEQERRQGEDEDRRAARPRRSAEAPPSGARPARGLVGEVTGSPSSTPRACASVAIMPRAGRVEPLHAVPQPADENRDRRARARCSRGSSRRARPGRRRPDRRCSANSAMKSSGRLPSADWTTPRRAGAEPRAELLRRGADEAGERGERDRRDEERRDVVEPSEMADPAASTSRPASPSSISSCLLSRPERQSGRTNVRSVEALRRLRPTNTGSSHRRPVAEAVTARSMLRRSLVLALALGASPRARRAGPRVAADRPQRDRHLARRQPQGEALLTYTRRRQVEARARVGRDQRDRAARRSPAAGVVQARLLGRLGQVPAGPLEDFKSTCRPTTAPRSPGR